MCTGYQVVLRKKMKQGEGMRRLVSPHHKEGTLGGHDSIVVFHLVPQRVRRTQSWIDLCQMFQTRRKRTPGPASELASSGWGVLLPVDLVEACPTCRCLEQKLERDRQEGNKNAICPQHQLFVSPRDQYVYVHTLSRSTATACRILYCQKVSPGVSITLGLAHLPGAQERRPLCRLAVLLSLLPPDPPQWAKLSPR